MIWWCGCNQVLGSILICLEAIFAMGLLSEVAEGFSGTRVISRCALQMNICSTYLRHCGSPSVAMQVAATQLRRRADLHSTALDCAWKHRVQHLGPLGLLPSLACWNTLHPTTQKTLLPLLEKEP